MAWISGFWKGLIDECRAKSEYGNEIGCDTLMRWIFVVLFFMGFFLMVYHFDQWMITYDKWTHVYLGWRLSDEPSPAKVSWHRVAAGALATVSIAAATGEYVICLYRRIKARIAASKEKESENNLHL